MTWSLLSGIRVGAVVLLTLALGLWVYLFVVREGMERPTLGRRGLKRRRALEEIDGFAAVDPLIRFLAAWIALLPLGRLRTRLDQQLTEAGEWLGLGPNEFLAASVLSGLFFGGLGTFMANYMQLGIGLGILFGGAGAMVPFLQVSSVTQHRFKVVNQRLPTAIDLMALCMGAGLDFPGALRQIVQRRAGDDPLAEEFGVILQELELGRTRRRALEEFSRRVPTDPVRDFVGAVVQAEEKGNPLAEVLKIQAQMLRMRRTIMVEEAASRAAVLLVAPLTMILIAVLILIIGPFMLRGFGEGLG